MCGLHASLVRLVVCLFICLFVADMGYKDLAEGLTELLKFVQVNAAATRKILIKCQKKTAFVGLPQEDLLHQYLKSRLRPDAESRLDQLRARTGGWLREGGHSQTNDTSTAVQVVWVVWVLWWPAQGWTSL